MEVKAFSFVLAKVFNWVLFSMVFIEIIEITNWEVLKNKLFFALILITICFKIANWIKDYELKNIEIELKKKQLEVAEKESKELKM